MSRGGAAAARVRRCRRTTARRAEARRARRRHASRIRRGAASKPAEHRRTSSVDTARDPDALDLEIAAPAIAEPEIVLHTPEAYEAPTTVPAGLITGHDPDARVGARAHALRRLAARPRARSSASRSGSPADSSPGRVSSRPRSRRRRRPATTPAPAREFTEAAAAPRAAAAPKLEVGSQKSEAEVPKAETPKAELPTPEVRTCRI